MKSPIKVLCAGIIVLDHGCSPIQHFPKEGELIATSGMALTLGGCAANVGVDLTKMGIHSKILGKIGDDDLGQIILEKLKQSGLDTSKIIKQSHSPTSQTIVINVTGQDRRFIHLIGANDGFSDTDFQKKDIEECKVVYLGGYLLMDKLSPFHVAEVFRTAQMNGAKTVLDVVTPGLGDHLAKLKPILPFVDVFLPNDSEAKLISGIDPPIEQAKFFKSLGVKTSIITLGNQGTILLNDHGCYKSDIFKMNYHDGSGSGDAFTAGYISGILENKSDIECLEIGSALGASCVRAQGTTEGVFKKEECVHFLARNKLEIKKLN
ncbi:MAG: carbohydrate kinase family protein [Planctomycetes bacterium]|nr:carbohydrate kinase family protein [Planctomycetota bacterium]NBY03336.1 carbohydrate kinase family protein [Planctomycetota bacterium]